MQTALPSVQRIRNHSEIFKKEERRSREKAASNVNRNQHTGNNE
jgi:hypothetical protein